MNSFEYIEKIRFEDLLGMGGGYVLDFTDRTYAEFFREVINVNINDKKYLAKGTSKANRMRSFWEIETDMVVGKILEQMLAIWLHKQFDKEQSLASNAYILAQNTIMRLLGKKPREISSEADFLRIDFSKVSVSKLPVEVSLIPILDDRLKEANICLNAGASLAVIMLAGSILEGLLLTYAESQPKLFNLASSSPKGADKKARSFQEWTLGNLIDVAHEINLLKLDVKKFSHSLRDFRNYIHPYAQRVSGFRPDRHTAKICLQVLNAAIADLCGERN